MQKIKAVIFDIDGTLANTIPLCIQAFRQALEPQLNRALSDKEIEAAFGPNEEGVISTFNPPDAKKAMKDFMHYYTSLHDSMCPQPFDGMRDLLHTLKSKGVRLAIATGKGKEASQFSLNQFGILPCFEIMENGAPEGSRKPDAINHIIKTFEVPKDATLYVGDSPDDVKESRTAGIHVVAAAWAGSARKEELKAEHPDAIFENVNDFREWLCERI